MATNVQDAILLFGDSLTQYAWNRGGFAQRLAWDYTRKLDVVSRGFAGYNTAWGLPVFEQCFPKAADKGQKVKLLMIWFGANDACLPHSPLHVPMDDCINNLREMIQLVRSPKSEYYSPDTRIILVTPTPIHEGLVTATLEQLVPGMQLDRKYETVKLYAQAIVQLGEKEAIPVINMFDLVWDAAGRDLAGLGKYLADGLHLAEPSYAVLYDSFMETIIANYPELHFNKIPLVFPDWMEINFKDPVPSLVPHPNRDPKS